MIVGMGVLRIRRRRNVMPSVLGISTSRVNTSGLCFSIATIAASGSGATPMTSILGSFSRDLRINCRATAESSITSTRILSITNWIKE